MISDNEILDGKFDEYYESLPDYQKQLSSPKPNPTNQNNQNDKTPKEKEEETKK